MARAAHGSAGRLCGQRGRVAHASSDSVQCIGQRWCRLCSKRARASILFLKYVAIICHVLVRMSLEGGGGHLGNRWADAARALASSTLVTWTPRAAVEETDVST